VSRKRVDRDRGLTLVELLVVLAVLALLSGLMASSLRSAASSWRHIARHNADRERRDAVTFLLRGLISEIAPTKFGNSSKLLVQFDGQRDHVDFLAPLSRRFRAQDIVLYRLRFTNDSKLRLSWQLDRQGSAAADDIVPSVADEVVADYSDGSFSYYGQLDEAGTPQWWPSWQGQANLPLLIKVNFTWQGIAQEFVAAPLVTGAFCATAEPDGAC
jgi:general secretion pathway protein J